MINKLLKWRIKYDLAKYITTPEFNKLTAENFTAKLEQANLVTKADFDKKLTSFNKRITLNKIRYLDAQKRQSNKRFYFFVYQSTLDKLHLNKKIY